MSPIIDLVNHPKMLEKIAKNYVDQFELKGYAAAQIYLSNVPPEFYQAIEEHIYAEFTKRGYKMGK